MKVNGWGRLAIVPGGVVDAQGLHHSGGGWWGR